MLRICLRGSSLFAKRSFEMMITEELSHNFLTSVLVFIHLFHLQKCSGRVKKVTPVQSYLKMQVLGLFSVTF